MIEPKSRDIGLGNNDKKLKDFLVKQGYPSLATLLGNTQKKKTTKNKQKII